VYVKIVRAIERGKRCVFLAMLHAGFVSQTDAYRGLPTRFARIRHDCGDCFSTLTRRRFISEYPIKHLAR